MHGLINKAIQSFVWTTYGAERWAAVMATADLGFSEFEAMLVYDDKQSLSLLDAVEKHLKRPLPEILEDLGTFLVSDRQLEALRRLLRFGGVTYVEFLHSLDDLPDRARLAVSDLHLPTLELRDLGSGRYCLTCGPGLVGFSSVMVGILRALADDYGALVMLEHSDNQNPTTDIIITLVETSFAEGRRFELGARAG
ncbi:MAG: heme NO-binding domain-containing protein [Paracoccaceae bacterium]